MKKLLFTALAVVAFSAVSMANTIEVKEEVVVNNESNVEKTVILEDSDSCQEFAMNMTDKTDLNPVDTHDFYQAMLSICYYFN
jgi:hypothetical protein